ncbi:g2563 [Coccomyxa viridis]|uniref:G2563 protein n=1 Tax=Coccomyxa viridis TaxID=1274662 RepID=A0ABP1FPM8_9CHLO
MVSTIFNHHIKVHPTSCQRSALRSVQDVHWHGERHVPALDPRRSYRHRLKRGACIQAQTVGSTLQKSNRDYVTFTNTSGNVLQKLADNVWAADRPFLWNGIDVGGRMAVLRLSDGSIWVHSPVSLDDELAAALAEIGEVKHIVTPNFEHTKYAQQWKERYPNAKSYGCPGISQKMPEVSFEEVGTSGTDPEEWLGEVQSTWLSYEHNPFTRSPFFNEVVFYFKPARLLVTSDLFWNYPKDRDVGIGTKLWKTGMDRVYLPFYRSFMVKDQGLYAEALGRIFKQWDFDSILPCHGDYVAQDGKRVLQEHLELVGERKRLISS